MENSKSQSAGGKATAIKLRKEALEKYYKDPNVCKNCSKVIEVNENERASTVKKKIFCNRSCSTQYNNRIKPKRKKRIREKKIKESKDKENLYFELTKEELENKHGGTYFNWRASISKNARKTFNNSGLCKKCIVCGYDNHVDIAHIVPVSEFDKSAKLSEINGMINLVPLCPNHHWEFDSGLITREEIIKIKNISREA
jgi:hypothetical protein